MVALLNDHITTSMNDNPRFKLWLNNNQTQYQQLLNKLVAEELPKLKAET